MLRRVARSVRRTVLVTVIGAVLGTVMGAGPATVFPSRVGMPAGAGIAGAVVRTGSGPVGREPPAQVRPAALRETPTGQQLPEPRLSAPAPPSGDDRIGDLIVPGIVVLGLAGTIAGLVRTLRGRRRAPAPPPVVAPAPGRPSRAVIRRSELPVTGAALPRLPSPRRR